jgi:hypothetical protein
VQASTLRATLTTQLRKASRLQAVEPLPGQVIVVQPQFRGMSANNFWSCDCAQVLGAEALR